MNPTILVFIGPGFLDQVPILSETLNPKPYLESKERTF